MHAFLLDIQAPDKFLAVRRCLSGRLRRIFYFSEEVITWAGGTEGNGWPTGSEAFHGAGRIAHGVEAFVIRRAAVPGVSQAHLVHAASRVDAFQAGTIGRALARLSQCKGTHAATAANFAIRLFARHSRSVVRVLFIFRNDVTRSFGAGDVT